MSNQSTHNATAAAWGWNPAVDLMDAAHCRHLLGMGHHTLARLGWADADIRQMERKAA